jgi:hypothetical protein
VLAVAYASRQPSYSIASIGAFVQVLAASYALFPQLHFRVEAPVLVSALVVTVLGVSYGLIVRPVQPIPLVSPVQFVNLTGLKLSAVGCIIQLFAITWSGIDHFSNQNDLVYGAPLGLLTVGMLSVELGMVIGLTIEYGMIKRELLVASSLKRQGIILVILLSFSSILLLTSGLLIDIARTFPSSLVNWVVAFTLSMFATFVLVPLKRIMPRFGSGIGLSIIFNAVIYLSLVLQGGFPLYLPLGILPVSLFDLLILVLSRSIEYRYVAVVSALVTGGFFGVLYYPFSVHLFPWALSLGPLIIVPLVGSAVGAILGISVYAALTTVVLGDVAGRI